MLRLARFFFIARISYRYFLPFSAWLIRRRAWKILYLTSDRKSDEVKKLQKKDDRIIKKITPNMIERDIGIFICNS